MENIPDHPDIASALRTGYPRPAFGWKKGDESEEASNLSDDERGEKITRRKTARNSEENQ